MIITDIYPGQLLKVKGQRFIYDILRRKTFFVYKADLIIVVTAYDTVGLIDTRILVVLHNNVMRKICRSMAFINNNFEDVSL